MSMDGGEKKIPMVRNVVEENGRSKLVYCAPNGIYIGEISYAALNLEMLRKMADDFRNYTSEVFAQALRSGSAGIGNVLPVARPPNGQHHG